MGRNGKILAAVSGSGRGLQVVESAATLASALGVGWHAIFIETPRTARDRSVSRRAADALAHAAQLGATVSSEPASSVSEGLVAHMETAPAAHLVIGPPSGLRNRPMLVGSYLRDLMARRPDLMIHIAPATADTPLVAATTPQPPAASPPRHYLIALALVLATLGVCELLGLFVGGRPLSLLFLFPVIAVAARFGLVPALAAVAMSVVTYDFFLLQPVFRLEPLAPPNLVLWIALGGVAIYTSSVTAVLRSRVALSDRSAQESARIATFAQTLARVSSWDDTAQAVCDEFASVLNAQTILFREKDGALVRAAACPPDAVWGAIDQAALDWCWANGEEAGAGTKNISAADWRLEPFKTSLGTLAVLALARSDGRDPIRADKQVLFVTLVGQAALAHERLVLEDGLRASARRSG